MSFEQYEIDGTNRHFRFEVDDVEKAWKACTDMKRWIKVFYGKGGKVKRKKGEKGEVGVKYKRKETFKIEAQQEVNFDLESLSFDSLSDLFDNDSDGEEGGEEVVYEEKLVETYVLTEIDNDAMEMKVSMEVKGSKAGQRLIGDMQLLIKIKDMGGKNVCVFTFTHQLDGSDVDPCQKSVFFCCVSCLEEAQLQNQMKRLKALDKAINKFNPDKPKKAKEA